MTDLFELAAEFTKDAAEVTPLAESAIDATARAVVDTAKSLVAVSAHPHHGVHTRDTIGYDHDGLEATVGPTTWWAYYIEHGGATTGPRPFMGPAADEHEATLEAELVAAVDVTFR